MTRVGICPSRSKRRNASNAVSTTSGLQEDRQLSKVDTMSCFCALYLSCVSGTGVVVDPSVEGLGGITIGLRCISLDMNTAIKNLMHSTATRSFRT